MNAKEKLERTFKEMFCEMDYKDITITELTKRAGVNRKTFYLHYKSIEQMLTEIQDQYIEETRQYSRIEDTEILTRIFLKMVDEQGKFGEKLWGDTDNGYLYHLVSNKARKELWPDWRGENKKQIDDENIILYYIQLTTVRIYSKWVRDGKPIPLEELSDLIVNILCEGVNATKRHDV